MDSSRSVYVVIIGLALGTYSRLTGLVPGSGSWAGNFGASVVGGGLRRRKSGAVAASRRRGGNDRTDDRNAVHYVPIRLARYGWGWLLFKYPLFAWLGVGIVVGALFGILGAAYRRRDAALGALFRTPNARKTIYLRAVCLIPVALVALTYMLGSIDRVYPVCDDALPILMVVTVRSCARSSAG